MVRRTSINLDMTLVADAKAALGTTELTQTIHRALQEVVRREKLRRLAGRAFPDLTPEALGRMREVHGGKLSCPT